MIQEGQPFGEDKNISGSEAELAGKSFHRMMDDLFTGTPEASQDMGVHYINRSLGLRIDDASGLPIMRIRLHNQTRLDDGDYLERVSLHEPGKSDDEWGRKFRQYVSNSDDKTVRRYDFATGQVADMADTVDITDAKAVVEELRTTFEGLGLEISTGLNGDIVGVEEVSDLRNLLATGTALPPVNPEG